MDPPPWGQSFPAQNWEENYEDPLTYDLYGFWKTFSCLDHFDGGHVGPIIFNLVLLTWKSKNNIPENSCIPSLLKMKPQVSEMWAEFPVPHNEINGTVPSKIDRKTIFWCVFTLYAQVKNGLFFTSSFEKLWPQNFELKIANLWQAKWKKSLEFESLSLFNSRH